MFVTEAHQLAPTPSIILLLSSGPTSRREEFRAKGTRWLATASRVSPLLSMGSATQWEESRAKGTRRRAPASRVSPLISIGPVSQREEPEPKGARRLAPTPSLNPAPADRSRPPEGRSPQGGRRRAAGAGLDPFSGGFGRWIPFAFACHLQDYRVMDKSVDRRCGCHRIFEYAVPFAENQIAGYD